MAKSIKPKLTEEDEVIQYMDKLEHPKKAEINTLRTIIKAASPLIMERIKWNAPSYYTQQDFLTFGPMKTGKLLLVFHHPSIVNIKSELLQGDYKDRRLMQFADMEAIEQCSNELSRIVKESVDCISTL